jgi:phosphoglycolate phosphatase
MTEIKGIIFDLDGTLIDSLETYTRALNRGIEKFNLGPILKEELATFLNKGLGVRSILSELYPFLAKEAIAQCNEEMIKAYLELVEDESVLLRPGVKEVLPQLKEMGLKIGIVTGRMTTGEQKWLELRRLGIEQFIEAIITGADAPRKPAPDGVIRCVNELGLSPEECIFVGDSQVDIISGKAAGTRTIAVCGGVVDEESLASKGPDVLISNLSELPSKISKLSRTTR